MLRNICLAQIRFVLNVPKQVTKPKGYVAALVTLILLIRSWTDRDETYFKSALNIPLSRIAFIGHLNYVKDAQVFYWLNPLHKSLAQL